MIAAAARAETAYDRFAGLVDRELHEKASPAEAAYLRHPSHVVAWHRELIFIRTDVEEQITECRLSDDPERQKTARLLSLRTVHKYVRRRQQEAQFIIEALALSDASLGRIVGSLHSLEHVIDSGRADDARHMIEALLDRLPQLLEGVA